MIVVAVHHLLDGVVVIAVVADLPLVADPIADGANGAGEWQDSLYLSLSPDSCRWLRHFGEAAGARPNPPLPVSAGQSHTMARPSR